MKTENFYCRSLSTSSIVRNPVIVISLIFLLSACTGMSSTQRSQWTRDAGQNLTCFKGPDCEVKWERALTWVKNNAEAPIKIANETIITTDYPYNSKDAYFSITKTENYPGSYTINFRANCSSVFGCSPSILELKASFANYVIKSIDTSTASESQKTDPKKDMIVRPKANLGVVTVKVNQITANKLGLKEVKGTRVTYVGPGAGFDSGLQLDDVIFKFAEHPINDDQELDAALENTVPPKTVLITIWRPGKGETAIPVYFEATPK